MYSFKYLQDHFLDLIMAEAPVRVPWKTARKRSRQKKERVEMRNFGQLLIKNQEKLQEELSELRESGAEAGSVKALSIWLEKSLTFKKVKDVGINPFLELPFAEGTWISKKMSYFLRHNMPHGQYSCQDGSVPISALERDLCFSREKILLATSPMYDTERKVQFVALEFFHPDASVTIRVAALGGHSFGVLAPPGHYLLGKESLQQLCPLVHNTSAVKDILLAGFISQQQRKGGVNFCAKESNYRPNASHAVKVETDSAIQLLELGYQFFGNRFCDTIYGMGMWEDSCWSGQIPTGFLEISSQEH